MTTDTKTLSDLKEELKAMAAEIRNYRRSPAADLSDFTLDERIKRYNRIETLPWEYRVRHIAYCLMRGTPYEKIEPKINPDTRWFLKFDAWPKIVRIMEEHGHESSVHSCPW